ncbi:arginine ABC transporter permease ArtQ [Thaumasiovibrio subtropicus]|uniref:arginine ABC transporter permease ArtQ n=1 Tax=Thaumasiovibrio subtropicus TaxID=1891207 RepID=UPI000B361C4C|nr:arginine ABC transporter permease ArtQ [Thaumasiovibrio subtropicus]
MALSGYPLTLLNAGWMTIQLALVSLLVGLIIALAFAAGEMSKWRLVSWPTTLLVTLLRGLPELLVVLFIFFGTSHAIFLLTGSFVEIDPFWSGVVALALIFAAYASQSIRGALKAVPKGQAEAAYALGFGKTATFFRFVLPQAVRHALPGLTNQWLVLLKDTALVSLIGVTDLMKQAQLIASATHESFTWYATVALIYLLITLISQKLIKRLSVYFEPPGQQKVSA